MDAPTKATGLPSQALSTSQRGRSVGASVPLGQPAIPAGTRQRASL